MGGAVYRVDRIAARRHHRGWPPMVSDNSEGEGPVIHSAGPASGYQTSARERAKTFAPTSTWRSETAGDQPLRVA